MANKKPPIKNQILADYLINSSHDLKSIGGLLVSGIVSTFGMYSIVLPFFTDGDKVNSSTLNVALFSFVIMLIIFDTVKRGSLTKFFNSLLKKKIISSSAKKGYLVISVFAIMFMVLLDALGSYATAEKGATLYSQFKTNGSTEFQILQQNAESGKATASNYTLELSAWKESKLDAKTNCNDKFKGWKAKYKAKCKEDWNNANPMPKQTADGQIKIDDYKSIKEDGKGFLDAWLFIILFTLLSLMTMLMQYLTIAKIYDDYNDIEESLTFERISFIGDNIEEHETILAEHEQKEAEMMAESKREKNNQDRKFNKVGQAIVIEHKKKNVETRGKTVQRIANNQYVNTESAKAGHVVNPFGENEDNNYLDLSKTSLTWNELNKYHMISVGYENEKVLNLTANETQGLISYFKKYADITSISYKDILFYLEHKHDEDSMLSNDYLDTEQIILRLWNNKKVKSGEKLTPKPKVINLKKMVQVKELSKVYKFLTDNGYAELRGNKGYFATVDYYRIQTP